MQADAYAGFNRLYGAGRKGGPIIEAARWAHARRQFFDLARLDKAPIAIEAAERIDACSRSSARSTVSLRNNACRCATSAAVRSSSHWRLGSANNAPSSLGRARSPRPSPIASPDGWHSRASSTMAGCACPTVRPSGRFASSPWVATTGPSPAPIRAATAPVRYTLIQTAKPNDVDPQAWLADVLARLQDHPAKRIDELLPWNWKRECQQKAAA